MSAIDADFVHEHRALIAVAEACWRPQTPSQSWHVFEWMAFKLSRKFPVVARTDRIIATDFLTN